MAGVCLRENENRKLHFVWCVQNYGIRKFAILVMSISINFVFLSLYTIILFPHHSLYRWQRNALIMVKLYMPELYFIPFDLHELIKTIVQSNRSNCKVKMKRRKMKKSVTESGCN